MNENISNKRFLTLAIFLVSLVGISGFLIGYGLNQGECPECTEKVVKVFTTKNEVDTIVDYNMVTSVIQKNLIGKYINKNNSEVYFEIKKDGTFLYQKYDLEKEQYIEYTNEEYVLLFYYDCREVEEIVEDVEKLETEEALLTEGQEKELEYKTTLYLIPKGNIEGDLITNIITFSDIEPTSDGISSIMIGPDNENTQYYIKE